MGQILVRDLDEAVIQAFEARAAAHGVSLEDELRDVLTRAASDTRAGLAQEFAAVRARTPHVERRLSEDLVRESRDER